MGIEDLLRLLGEEIQAPDEEHFDLFAQQLPSGNLGFIDPKAKTLELTVAGRDLTIHQSPAVLASSRAGGTTGAVVWKITPLFVEWISSPTNPLFTQEILTSESCVIELGCGIAGIVGLLLAPRISTYVLTDQIYVAKLLEENITENTQSSSSSASKPHNPKQRTAKSSKSSLAASKTGGGGGQIRFTTLDWETDEATPSLITSSTVLFPPGPSSSAAQTSTSRRAFDAVLACDCIYNYALVEPFVSTCVDLCRLKQRSSSANRQRQSGDDESAEKEAENPCICVVGQQLREPSVFEDFLKAFAEEFHVWRIPDLASNSGFVVHLGVLKGSVRPELLEELKALTGSRNGA
ncbi:ribosomal lysine N-methyltransferase 5 [Rhypophila decipiens]